MPALCNITHSFERYESVLEQEETQNENMWRLLVPGQTARVTAF